MVINVPVKRRVRWAGEILAAENSSEHDREAATALLSQWRELHYYPINAFRALLDNHCKKNFKPKEYIIAQRLKRAPSIIRKLRRFKHMDLSQMQDIGGLRVIVPTIKDVYILHESILNNERTDHEAGRLDDYITTPKSDGYRSLHQIFKYSSKQNPELNGLRVELQIRTRLQHAWATAVETLGMIEKASFKTGEGNEEFKTFFKVSADLFAAKDKKESFDLEQLKKLKTLNQQLNIINKLKGLTIAAEKVENPASKDNKNPFYYVVQLSIEDSSVSMTPFTKKQIKVAELLYTAIEKTIIDDPSQEVVLISVNHIKEIKKAYPNYFLDTQVFVNETEKLLKKEP